MYVRAHSFGKSFPGSNLNLLCCNELAYSHCRPNSIKAWLTKAYHFLPNKIFRSPCSFHGDSADK